VPARFTAAVLGNRVRDRGFLRLAAVSGTEAFTFSTGLVSGILAKSAGRVLPDT